MKEPSYWQEILAVSVVLIAREIVAKIFNFIKSLITRGQTTGVNMSEVENKPEVEGKIGSGGSYSLDVQGNGICKAEMTYSEGALKGGASIEFDVVVVLEKLAAKSENKIDDSLVAMIKAALGR